VDEVTFGEINWSEEKYSRAFGVNQGPGDGGWPTIRYFNLGTGYGGKGYKQKEHDLELDAELGKEENMRSYVLDKSGASPCDVVWGSDCSVMELKYISKWVGPGVSRSRPKVAGAFEEWMKQLQVPNIKNFAQNKQRLTLLSRLLHNFDHPEL